LSMGGIVVSQTLKTAGDAFNEAIVRYTAETFGLYIDRKTAEKLKTEIGSTHFRGEPLTRKEVKGRDIDAGFPRRVTLTSDHIREALAPEIRTIVTAVCNIIEKTPPDLASDIAGRGIVIAGGGAQIAGLEDAIERATGMRTILCDDPQTAVARGTGLYLRALFDMKKSWGL
ncbi:MAG: rod shape-determining protein, partial [Eubacterium sp.]|nr:rod shape-determining protein [Eubacterium sp.]